MNKIVTLGFFGGLALAVAASASAANANSFNGFGEDIPLASAAKQIVPDGWHVDFGVGVDKSAKVSWSSAADWKAALSSAAAKRGYQVQYGDSSVIVTKGGARVATAPTAKKSPVTSDRHAYAGPRKEAIGGKRHKKVVSERLEQDSPAAGGGGFVIASVKGSKVSTNSSEWREYKVGKDGDGESAAAPTSLRVNEGDSLRPVIDAWAEKNGWKLVWKSEFNYPISASASFDGDFVQSTTSLIKAFDAARPMITVDFYTGNNVVVISNASSDEAN